MKQLNRLPVIPKSHQITWWICRGLLFLWGGVMMFMGHTTEFLEAMFAIIFTHLWDMFQLFGGRSFITRVPYYLHTYLNLFICFGVVVGSTVNKFTTFEYIDLPEHFFAGFIGSVGGYELAVTIQAKQPKDKRISPALASLFALGFSVTIAVGWEFYEFTMDRLYGLNLQRSAFFTEAGLVDTMVDMIFAAAGALMGMFITAFRRNHVFEKRKVKKQMKSKNKS